MLGSLLLAGATRTTIVVPARGEWLAADLAARALPYLQRASTVSERVLVAMSNSPETVGLVLGAVAMGQSIVSTPAPASAEDAVCVREIQQRARYSGATVLLTDAESARRLNSAISGIEVWAVDILGSQGDLPDAGEGFELVQHSSGTTGNAKAIVLGERALYANLSAMLERLSVCTGDSSISWLPLSHDMGLVGIVLSSILAAAHIGEVSCVLSTPQQFLRSPNRWLKLVAESGSTITALPDFALRAILRRTHARGDLDLSALRAIIVGAETVRATSLSDFQEAMQGCGLRPTALCPGYGMAEFGVAVSMVAPSDMWSTAEISIAPGRQQVKAVVSGPPLDGYEVNTQSDVYISEIGVRGPSLGSALDGSVLSDVDGWYRTGDIGQIVDAGVAVVGRVGDSLVVNGRHVLATAAEAAVAPSLVRLGRLAALVDAEGRFTVVVEPARHEGLTEALATISREVSRAVGVAPERVVALRRGQLPVTASGKVRREELFRGLAVERFDVLAETQTQETAD